MVIIEVSIDQEWDYVGSGEKNVNHERTPSSISIRSSHFFLSTL